MNFSIDFRISPNYRLSYDLKFDWKEGDFLRVIISFFNEEHNYSYIHLELLGLYSVIGVYTP